MKAITLCTMLAAAFMMQSALGVDAPISALGAAGTLSGTFENSQGGGEHPQVVLIIPGSGPTDRDGNSPLGIAAAPYRLLAEALANSGISSVRIDKRGMFGSAATGLDANEVTIDAYASDVHAWIKKLLNRTGNRCVWVLGHSEGALVAEVAARNGDGICGLILVSGAGRNAADLLTSQLKENAANAPILSQALTAIDALRAGHRVDVSSFPAPLQHLFNPAVQDYEINWFSFDPVNELKVFRGPVLVIQGTHDLQTSVPDAEKLSSARPGITLKTIDGMNHVWKIPAGGRAANLASYRDSSLPLAPGLAKAVTDFIKVHGTH
jgi:pimeloyl-ACP methyl ester carboxylesterase